MTDAEMMAELGGAEAEPKAPEPGMEFRVPMAALTAAGENAGDEAVKPAEGDAVAVQLEGKFVREEGGMGVFRATLANGEPLAEPAPAPSEDEAMEADGMALRQAAEKGGY